MADTTRSIGAALDKNPCAPSAAAWRITAGSSRPETIPTGTLGLIARSKARPEKPCTSGSIRSSTIKSGLTAASSISAGRTAKLSPAAANRARRDTEALARTIGTPGEQNGQVYKITIGRSDFTMKEMGATINARMGLNTWAAFYGNDADAVVAGDQEQARALAEELRALQAGPAAPPLRQVR